MIIGKRKQIGASFAMTIDLKEIKHKSLLRCFSSPVLAEYPLTFTAILKIFQTKKYKKLNEAKL